MAEDDGSLPGRSCFACKRRKIRCDRQKPCSYCVKLTQKCTYPTLEQNARKISNDDVVTRLTKIEESLRRIETRVASSDGVHGGMGQDNHSSSDQDSNLDQYSARFDRSGARLVPDAEGPRYVTGSFWTDLERSETDDAEENEMPFTDHQCTPPRAMPTASSGLFSSTNATPEEINQLHPTESRIFTLWQVFIESVDPVIKLVHVPTTQRQIILACQDLYNVPPSFASLMFSIYHAAVVSMQSSVSLSNLTATERHMFLDQYRTGIEMSLAQANFMAKPNITMIQALALYLTCARQYLDKAYIWSMVGLLVRLATKIGLHRDPEDLGLPAFTSEIRRRVWWQIFTLDVRIAEDNDMEPLIYEHMYDTRLPTNLDDSELDPHSVHALSRGRICTGILFSLIRFEITRVARRLLFSRKFSSDNGYQLLSLGEKNKMVGNMLEELDRKYFIHFSDEIPILFVTRTAAKTVLAKIKLALNHPSRTESRDIAPDSLHDLIASAMDIIQYTHGLRSNDKYSKWVWLFEKYIEWDAVAFLLHSLKAICSAEMLAKATDTIDRFFDDWSDKVSESDQRWQRLLSLRRKATSRSVFLESRSQTDHQSLTDAASSDRSQVHINSRRPDANRSLRDLPVSDIARAEVRDPYDDLSLQGALGNLHSWSPMNSTNWTFDDGAFSVWAPASWETSVIEDIFPTT